MPGWCGARHEPPSALFRPAVRDLCQVNRETRPGSSFKGVANGGVSVIALAGGVIVGLLSVHELSRGIIRTVMPMATHRSGAGQEVCPESVIG
ncbi:Syd protein [Streptomyces sp. NBRC 110611]|nr:Syd protein [Streptomyces sp. NBRC 110611]